MEWIEVNELFYERLSEFIPEGFKKIEEDRYYLSSPIEGIDTHSLIKWLYEYPFKAGKSNLEVYRNFMTMPVEQLKSEIVLARLEK